MQRIKATVWLRRYYSPHGRPSETWLTKQLREGEIPGEKVGGAWFVHVKDGTLELDYGGAHAANDAGEAAEALLEDWLDGAKSPQQAVS